LDILLFLVMDITHVSYQPPSDPHLSIEALTIDDLRQRAPPEHFRKLQRADFFRLFGVLKGSTSPMVDFQSHSLQDADWLLVTPGEVFRYDFERQWSGWVVVFSPQVLIKGMGVHGRQDVDLLHRVGYMTSPISLDPMQHRCMCETAQQLKLDALLLHDAPLRNELLRLQLTSMLYRLSMWHLQAHQPLQRAGLLQQFRQLLEDEHTKWHQVRQYANAMGVSEKTLSRICLTATGVPAKATINQRLLLEAKRQLAYTRLPIKSVGHAIGFDEPSHFVRFFRREAGLSPMAFRLAESD
jgi:AraC-like DNA-binding protein